MRIYDVSVPLCEGMPAYPGDPGAKIMPVKQRAKGDAFNLSQLTLGSHTGTHIDAPRHFLEEGVTVDRLPWSALLGEALVCHLPVAEAITTAELTSAGIPERINRIIFKTRNSELWSSPRFRRDFVYLSPDAADWLLGRGVELVGIDYLSLERFGAPKAEVHLKLLGAGVVLLEGLDLSEVPAGRYTLLCLPLRVEGCDGAPARVLLLEGTWP